MTLLLTPTLEQINRLEAERTRILWRDYLTPPERARLREITETLPALWEARRQELAPRPEPKTLQEAREYDARVKSGLVRAPRSVGKKQTKPCPSCPSCHRSTPVYRHGHYVTGLQRYRCKDCHVCFGNERAA